MSTPPKRSTAPANAAATAGLARDVAADREPVVAEVRDRGARAVRVEVEGDDARARRVQRVADRAADPAGAAGDERDRALQLAGRRRLRELVELERPVLDREALRASSETKRPSASAPAMTSIARW